MSKLTGCSPPKMVTVEEETLEGPRKLELLLAHLVCLAGPGRARTPAPTHPGQDDGGRGVKQMSHSERRRLLQPYPTACPSPCLLIHGGERETSPLFSLSEAGAGFPASVSHRRVAFRVKSRNVPDHTFQSLTQMTWLFWSLQKLSVLSGQGCASVTLALRKLGWETAMSVRLRQ